MECTLNRVGDHFADQIFRSGHAARIDDLDAFADLGITTLRYPILWEQISPDAPDRCDWSWHDARLDRLRMLGISPIVGLVHHGSGPSYTDLLDDGFAPGLARHAAHVVERYPWVELWNPVNEPVTTARFSALYGHWHPHARDEISFWRALLNQIDGVRCAMAAIRAAVPHARLIQTDDLGRSYATGQLAPQADFDNERRWAGWDLLCGRLIPGHPLWARLCGFGFEEQLLLIADAPCPPDIIGINHYLTSDRFLDHRTELYPTAVHGACGLGPVADVEAVRAVVPAPAGIEGALREAWARYKLPMALTEIHLGCTREEQLRWFVEAWETASTLREEGLVIVAVTAWSLLGAYDWASLLTRSEGRYESGAFDVSAGYRRPTALAALIRDLTDGQPATHPLVAQRGWWRQEARLAYPPHRIAATPVPSIPPVPEVDCAPLLIVGATGTLGQAFAGACRLRNIPYVLADRARLPLGNTAKIAAQLEVLRPWAVVNAAGWVRVDEAEHDPAGCFAANRDGSLELARACAEHGVALTSFSSDLVFDGLTNRPYIEGDATAPLGIYGRSKADADAAILAMDGDMLVIRTASFFSPYDTHNFAAQLVAALRDGRPFRAASDCVTSPTYVPDLVRITLDLMIDGETGLRHLVNKGAATWADFACTLAVATGLDGDLIERVPQSAMGWSVRRPQRAAMASTRCGLMPDLEDAIVRFAGRV